MRLCVPDEELAQVISAQDEVLAQIRLGERSPGQVLDALEHLNQTFSSDVLRGAVWSLVSRGDVEVSWDGKMRLAGSLPDSL